MENAGNHNFENKPIFSIIMPCYNSANYVERAIKSCLNQTFENLELIIINDGSTDNTLEIIKSYTSKDERISVFSKENGGYISAVNYGLEHINGIYFMLLGSDDEICPSLFSEIVKNIDTNRYPDMIGFKTIIKKSDGSCKNDKYSDFSTCVEEHNTDIKSFSAKFPKHSDIFFTRDTSKLYKSDLLGSLRYFGKKGMDADGIFAMLFAHKVESFLCVPEFGYVWYLREESLSGRKKDYSTQVDRINNWKLFRDAIMLLDYDLVTSREKYYLIDYFYSIIEYTFAAYPIKCLKNNTIKDAKIFLYDNSVTFSEMKLKKNIQLMLRHTYIWMIRTIFVCYKRKVKKFLISMK